MLNEAFDAFGVAPGASAAVLVDDEGNLMPGVVDTNAPLATQRQQLYEAARAIAYDSEGVYTCLDGSADDCLAARQPIGRWNHLSGEAT